MSETAVAQKSNAPKVASTGYKVHSSNYEEIVKTLQLYLDGCRAGNSELMRPAFYAGASLVGYVGPELLFTPIQFLYDWIDTNGPAPGIRPKIASIEILNTVAVARVEVEEWSGKNAGSGVHMSDLFNLIQIADGWKISQKMFHWHAKK
jgi:hypothetical protein